MQSIQPSNTDDKKFQGENGLVWVRKLGIIGFLFFLVKGLAWVILPILLLQFGIKF